MAFNTGYQYGMTPARIISRWPNLVENSNFIFTSEQTWVYNCVKWALGLDDEFKQFSYTDDGELYYDESLETYTDYFEEQGFELCDGDELEESFDKIAFYTDRNNLFTHVSRQLMDGRWASKMGNYEDIEHNTLNDLSGNFYGKPKVFMKRKRE